MHLRLIYTRLEVMVPTPQICNNFPVFSKIHHIGAILPMRYIPFGAIVVEFKVKTSELGRYLGIHRNTLYRWEQSRPKMMRVLRFGYYMMKVLGLLEKKDA